MKKIILSLTVIFAVILFTNTQTVNAQTNTVYIYVPSPVPSGLSYNKVIYTYFYNDGTHDKAESITIPANMTWPIQKQKSQPGYLEIRVPNYVNCGWSIEGTQHINFTGDEQINVVFHWRKNGITEAENALMNDIP